MGIPSPISCRRENRTAGGCIDEWGQVALCERGQQYWGWIREWSIIFATLGQQNNQTSPASSCIPHEGGNHGHRQDKIGWVYYMVISPFEKLTLCVRLLFASFPNGTDVTRTPPTSLVLWVSHWCQYGLHHKFQGHNWENVLLWRKGKCQVYRCPYQPLPLLPLVVPVFWSVWPSTVTPPNRNRHRQTFEEGWAVLLSTRAGGF